MAPKTFEIVAHRGVTSRAPENTLDAFQHAVELGADAIELDVRLTADRVPVVYHYFYLDENTSASGSIFDYNFEQLQQVKIVGKTGQDNYQIPTLAEVLDRFADKIGLEIEIKGPEPEAVSIIGNILGAFRHRWERIEVTSYEPALLRDIQEYCPGLATDLLLPHSESWMRLDVVAYQAIHRARLARVRAVHLHPTQLSAEVVSAIRGWGFEVHAWGVNDEPSLQTIAILNLPKICTDNFQQALNFRSREIQRVGVVK